MSDQLETSHIAAATCRNSGSVATPAYDVNMVGADYDARVQDANTLHLTQGLYLEALHITG